MSGVRLDPAIAHGRKNASPRAGHTLEVDAGCELLETKLIDGVFPDDRRLLQSPPAHRTELPRKAPILGR